MGKAALEHIDNWRNEVANAHRLTVGVLRNNSRFHFDNATILIDVDAAIIAAGHAGLEASYKFADVAQDIFKKHSEIEAARATALDAIGKLRPLVEAAKASTRAHNLGME